MVPRAGFEPARAEAQRILSQQSLAKLLNKLSVSELVELSKLSKSYISQVKHSRRPPSERLLNALQQFSNKGNKGNGAEIVRGVDLFLKSRREGLSRRTIDGFYRVYLVKAIPVLGLTPTPKAMNAFLGSLSCSDSGKHAYFRALRAFYRWLYSPRSGFNLRPDSNPISLIDPPKIPKLILPSLSRGQVELLIEKAHHVRDKAIVCLFAESGLRLSELVNIKLKDIDWELRIIRVLGKGKKEGYSPFGSLTEHYLKLWLAEYKPKPQQHIWDIGAWGVTAMLDRLRQETGLPCNPHTFRRTFACLLRKAGVDTMTIKDLGRWESLEMVQRYTRSLTFEDCMKHYKAPLSEAL